MRYAQCMQLMRGAPKELPFRLDDETLRRGLNFTFETDIGKIDILGEVQGVGGYEECREGASELELFGCACQVIPLKKLIAAKRARGEIQGSCGAAGTRGDPRASASMWR